MMNKSSNYKERHEEFVSNLSGASVLTLIICLCHIPVFILLLKLAQRDNKPFLFRDFFLLMLPLLSIITVTAEFNFLTLVSLVPLSIILLYWNRKAQMNNSRKSSDPNTMHNKTSYITLLKGANVALTCLAILAVDFTIFPRYFGKTEFFGISLMDIGVGTFIFSSAITSKYARGISSATIPSTESFPGRNASLFGTLLRLTEHYLQSLGVSFRRFLVLLLGFGRLIALKILDYPEHVSEYGIHWNFFMTLFMVWLVTDILHQFIARRYLIIISCLWLSIYQLLLCQTTLTTYLFSNHRETFLDANKEGIFSLNGYIPLFLLSESLAFHLFYSSTGNVLSALPVEIGKKKLQKKVSINQSLHQRREGISPIETKKPESDNNHLLLSKESESSLLTETVKEVSSCLQEEKETTEISPKVVMTSSTLSSMPFNYYLLQRSLLYLILLWLVWILQEYWIQPTSRRLCNSTYVTLVLGLSLLLVILIHVVDCLGGMDIPIITLHYMNQYSIMVFLGANICTGLVNHVFETIDMTTRPAFMILLVYTFVVTSMAWFTARLMSQKT